MVGLALVPASQCRDDAHRRLPVVEAAQEPDPGRGRGYQVRVRAFNSTVSSATERA